MALQNGNPSGRGGRRPGAGRKPKLATVARRRLQEQKVVDAEYAYALLAAWMRDEDQPQSLRLGCALHVMNRVWGKSSQPIDLAAVVAADDLTKLSEQERYRRILEIFDRARARGARPAAARGRKGALRHPAQ